MVLKFKNFFSRCSLQVYRNTVDYATLLNSFISFRSFFIDSMGFFYLENHVCKESKIYIFFSYLYAFYFFFLPYLHWQWHGLAWTYTVMMNRSDKNRHSYLLGLRGKAFSLSPLSMMLAVDFVAVLYQVKEIPLFLVFIMNGC